MTDRGEIIRAFLQRHVRGAAVGDGDDVFAKGWVTSLFAMQLVTFLEDTFAIEIDNDDLVLDNFRTVERMAALVERTLARGRQ